MTLARDAQLAGLEALTLDALRIKWTAVCRRPPPRVSRDLLALAVSHAIQTEAWGSLPPAARRALRAAGQAKRHTLSHAMPGTRLIREWHGTAHIVEIGHDGTIRWNDRDWRSLSEVARAITGTRWSGPAFFGVNKIGNAR